MVSILRYSRRVRFIDSEISGIRMVEIEKLRDERGYLARTYDADAFATEGIHAPVVLTYISSNRRAGTIRGLHYQVAPATETKLIRCTVGAIFAVAVDMRPASPTRLRHVGVELTAATGSALVVPELCAAGYQALVDGAEILNTVTGRHSPAHERGIRFDDPAIGIGWPQPVTVVSPKDQAWPLVGAEG